MTGPDPAVAAQRGAVRASLADVPRGSLVLVACSGGADSLALAAAAAFVGPRARVRVGAVVVDHRIQPGSDAVAARAAAQCTRLGLDPVEVVAVDVEPDGQGPEAAAREDRHGALAAAAERTGAVAVLLGHTLDDQAETVLLGLARGSGPRSLAGMAPAGPGLLRRPFLGQRREATRAACAALGLDPWHDPTNLDGPTSPVRSRLRHRALPALEEVLGPVAPALARTADRLREEDELLETLADEVLERALGAADAHVEGGGTSPLVLDVDVLTEAAAALRRRALHRALQRAGVRPGALSRAHVLAVEALVVDWRGQGPVSLPGGGEARRACGRLTLAAHDHDGGQDPRTDREL